jgi:hypothetical protein
MNSGEFSRVHHQKTENVLSNQGILVGVSFQNEEDEVTL